MSRGFFGASLGIVGNDAGRFEAEASKDGGIQTGPRQHGEGLRRVPKGYGEFWSAMETLSWFVPGPVKRTGSLMSYGNSKYQLVMPPPSQK